MKNLILYSMIIALVIFFRCSDRSALIKNTKSSQPRYTIENLSYELKHRFLGPLFTKVQDPMFSEKFEIKVVVQMLEAGWVLDRLLIDYDGIRKRTVKNDEIHAIRNSLKEFYGNDVSFDAHEIEVIPIIPIFLRRSTDKDTYTKTINLYWGGPALNYFVITVKDKEMLIHYFKPK
ncbi:MAG: hypothetical protein ABUK01_13840 [Leptospirales bacterium]